MKWEHKEQTLQQRIATHEKFAKYEINDWILDQIGLKPTDTVLDIGCGTGKQLIEYAKVASRVEGMDVSADLVDEARKNINRLDLKNVRLTNASADNKLPYEDNTFDVVSCCFSIYYYKDVEFTLNEIKRVLKPNGRLFVAAPTRNNISELLSLTGIKTPYVTRTECEIIPLITFRFNKTRIEIFRNPVTFPDINSFKDYYGSALVFKDNVTTKEELAIMATVKSAIAKNGGFTMTKRVYGITGSAN